jgi:hypothetical protein
MSEIGPDQMTTMWTWDRPSARLMTMGLRTDGNGPETVEMPADAAIRDCRGDRY